MNENSTLSLQVSSTVSLSVCLSLCLSLVDERELDAEFAGEHDCLSVSVCLLSVEYVTSCLSICATSTHYCSAQLLS